MVPFTRYLPSAINETTVTRPPYSFRVTAVALLASAVLEEPVRGEQDREHSLLRGGWYGDHAISLHVPGVRAADQQCPVPFPSNRSTAAAPGGIAPLPDDHLLFRGVRAEIDGSCVACQLEPRPILSRGIVLANPAEPAGPGILDGRPCWSRPVFLRRLAGRCEHPALRPARPSAPQRQRRVQLVSRPSVP